VIDTAMRVVASGAISANGHGNMSIRVPGAQELYYTAAPSLREHPRSAVVRPGLDGTLLEGNLPPIQGAVVAMHTAMYTDRADVGCVLHTHSPYATAYAVAGRPIGCWVESLAILVGGVVEEAAMAGINAGSIGGPIEIPEARRGAALQRAMTFEGMGIQHA
jgi:ribulose-5-phosphate 4-epimerase/fuculose-1-phosphate aldolase